MFLTSDAPSEPPLRAAGIIPPMPPLPAPVLVLAVADLMSGVADALAGVEETAAGWTAPDEPMPAPPLMPLPPRPLPAPPALCAPDLAGLALAGLIGDPVPAGLAPPIWPIDCAAWPSEDSGLFCPSDCAALAGACMIWLIASWPPEAPSLVSFLDFFLSKSLGSLVVLSPAPGWSCGLVPPAFGASFGSGTPGVIGVLMV
ncbi:Uncharacterised protein [Mycobacteroides abscessus subsp. abscessus]|nr:Uncharacterised protein [Mycobacteroides abscessus subsp. abscessus]